MKDKPSSKPIGIGSLTTWAREDNPALYNSCFNKKGVDWTRLTHYTFALALEKKLLQGEGNEDKSKVVFTGTKRDMEGYLFNGTFWKELGLHSAELKKHYFAQMYEEISWSLRKLNNILTIKHVLWQWCRSFRRVKKPKKKNIYTITL